MPRNLLPPLKQGNNVAVADPPGAWSPFEQAWTLAKQVALPAEDVHLGWSDITSIPSPWARILLFRHALEEGAPTRSSRRWRATSSTPWSWSSSSSTSRGSAS